MKPETWDLLNLRARQALLAEKAMLGMERQVEHMLEEGIPEIHLMPVVESVKHLRGIVTKLKRECGIIVKGEPVWEFVNETRGLAGASFVFLGAMPPLTEFAGPRKVWKYCGLHVVNGAMPRMVRGESGGFSPQLRAQAIVRLAEPCIKTGGPYRIVYDNRKHHTTTVSHPPMLEEGAGCEFCDAAYEKRRKTKKNGWDCSSVGGIHWRPSHRNVDARRVMAKAILKDLWRVENGMESVVQVKTVSHGTDGRGAPSQKNEEAA